MTAFKGREFITRLNGFVALAALIVLMDPHATAYAAVGQPQKAVPAKRCPKPADPIAIQSIVLSTNSIQTGQVVTGTVVATCNVAAVTARVGTYQIGVPKIASGLFRTTVVVPPVVWPGRYTVVVTAIRTDGATVSTDVPVEVHW